MHINLKPPSERQFRPCLAGALFRFRAIIGIGLSLLALSLAAPALRAQGGQPVAALSSNRFLFIVDTSAAMKRMAPDVIKIISEILDSSASGQLRAGDSLGLWTFNQEVYSELPAQKWNFAEREKISARTVDFLKHRRLENSSHLERVMPDLLDVIKASDIITVFIISNGEGKMKGTPFDDEINAQYRQSLKDMGGQRMPIVTVLQAKGGRILKFTINVFPWPVVVPELPLPIKLPPESQPQPAPATIAQTAPAAINPMPAPRPPLVLPKPAPAPAAKTEAAVPAMAVAPSAAPPAPNFPVPPPPPTTAPPPLVLPKSSPPVFLPPSPIPVTENKPKSVSPTQPPPLAPATPAAPAIIAKANPPVNAPAQNPVPLLKPTPAPPPVPSSPPLLTPRDTADSHSPPPLAIAPTDIIGRSKSLLIAVVALVLVALLLTGLILHRYFDHSGPSLITRSMGNGKK